MQAGEKIKTLNNGMEKQKWEIRNEYTYSTIAIKINRMNSLIKYLENFAEFVSSLPSILCVRARSGASVVSDSLYPFGL